MPDENTDYVRFFVGNINVNDPAALSAALDDLAHVLSTRLSREQLHALLDSHGQVHPMLQD